MGPTKPKKSHKKEISLDSIAGKQGWKRAKSVSPGKEAATVSRASEPKGKEEEKVSSDKPINDRTSFHQEVAQPSQLLVEDVFNLLMSEYADISTASAFQEVSQSLKKLSENTDFKKLADLRKSAQWSIKDEIALRILLIVSQTASPTIEDLKKASTLDINLSPKEASKIVSKIENNFKQIQTAWNGLLQSMTNFTPMMTTTGVSILKQCFTPLVCLGVNIVFDIGSEIILRGGNPFSVVNIDLNKAFLYSGIVSPLTILVDYRFALRIAPVGLSGLLYSIPLALTIAAGVVGTDVIMTHGLGPITQFKAAATAVMNSITQNTDLS